MDYDKEFAKLGKYSSAGLAHDLKRHLIDGYGFWNAGDVVRHLGGEQNMYKSYYIKIEDTANKYGKVEAARVAAEAAEYARQKKNLLQFWGFVLEETLYTDDINKFIDVALSTCEYCFVQGKANPPFWLYFHGLTICHEAYLEYRSAYSRRDIRKARICIFILYHVVMFIMDIYKTKKEYKFYDESLYYFLIMLKYSKILMSDKWSETEKKQNWEKTFEEGLDTVMQESPNWQAIIARLKNDKNP